MRRYILLLIIAFLSTGHTTGLQAQSSGFKVDTFSIAALQEDLTVLRTVLETVHIGLYRYTDKRQMDSLFDRSFRHLSEPLTEEAFFKLITPLVAAIRDEHTFTLPSAGYWKSIIGQTDYASSAPATTSTFFPFFLKVINQEVFIENNLSENLSLQAGDQIISINGQPIKDVLNILLPTIATNGYIETFKYRHLEQYSLHQTYNRFMVHYAIFIGRPDSFHLAIKKPHDRRTQQISVAALPASNIFNYYWRRYSTLNDFKKSRENPLQFNFYSKETAYLRLSDFHSNIWSKYHYSHSTEFRIFFESIRDKNIKHLIIDLRDNEGGNPAIGIELLQYLCTDTFRPYNYHEVINYRFPSLKKYFRDSTALEQLPAEVFLASGHNTFRSNPQYKSESWSRPMQPSQHTFRGKVYVLINGATGSAASILATLIRVNRRDALFIGEECGGDMEGPISGSGTDITLPHTKIRVDIPFIQRRINLNGFKPQKGKGVMPDHQIAPSVTDLIRHEDTVLNFTIQLIHK